MSRTTCKRSGARKKCPEPIGLTEWLNELKHCWKDDEGKTTREIVEALGKDPDSAYHVAQVRRMLQKALREGRVKEGRARRQRLGGSTIAAVYYPVQPSPDRSSHAQATQRE